MQTKPDKIIDVFKLILVYSYCTTKHSNDIVMNQKSFAEFLDISNRTIVRHFNLAKELGFIEVTSKHYIYNGKQKSKWLANVYDVDLPKLNKYIYDKTGYDMLNNIEKEIPLYYKFMKYCKHVKKEKLLASMTPQEQIEYEEKEAKKEQKRSNQLTKLKEQNKYFIDLLKEVNNDIIPNYYLEDNKKRLVNVLCSTKNPENSDDMNRLNILTKFFGTSDIVEFDTNASIYRLSYALGHGECADPNIDMYKLIFDKCNFKLPWNKTIRVNFKHLLMPIYMRESTIKYKSLVYEKRKNREWFTDKKEEEIYVFYQYLERKLKMPIYDIFIIVKDAMHEVFGLKKFYKADIFIYESNLHILMLKKFKDLGIKTINVYDGFYFINGTMNQELYNKIYNDSVTELLNLLPKK